MKYSMRNHLEKVIPSSFLLQQCQPNLEIFRACLSQIEQFRIHLTLCIQSVHPFNFSFQPCINIVLAALDFLQPVRSKLIGDILSDWYELSNSFHDMSSEGALCLLIRIFKKNTASLKPLRPQIRKLFGQRSDPNIFLIAASQFHKCVCPSISAF